MKRDALATLNAHRAARQPVALVTHLASGEGVVFGSDAQPLTAQLSSLFSFPPPLTPPRHYMGGGGQMADSPPPACGGEGVGVGGITLIKAIQTAIQTAFQTGKSGLVRVEGEDYFITIHLPPSRLIVIGAVHISQYLAEMARMVSLDCTIIDPRTAFATPERFAGVNLLAEWPQDVLPVLKPDAFTAFAALTHDPKIDDPALDAALKAGCFYIGALGSRKTHAARRARLQALGHTEAALDAIHAPIGLDIGAISPSEIAVSILAEIIAAIRKKAS